MKDHKFSHHGVWIEFMIMLGVLGIVIAYTLLSTLRVREATKQNENMLQATIKMQNIIELYGATGMSGNDIVYKQFYYDDAWNEISSQEEAAYYLIIKKNSTIKSGKEVVELNLTMQRKDGTEITALTGAYLSRS